MMKKESNLSTMDVVDVYTSKSSPQPISLLLPNGMDGNSDNMELVVKEKRSLDNDEIDEEEEEEEGDDDVGEQVKEPPKKKRKRKRRRRSRKSSAGSNLNNVVDQVVIENNSDPNPLVTVVPASANSPTNHPQSSIESNNNNGNNKVITNTTTSKSIWTRENMPKKLMKYYNQRYSLFSKFDQGVQLDEEGWYSVTPETIAKHIAERCACKIIVDAMCGIGGNTIQFASKCDKVIAIDHSPFKIEMAKHNAFVYGVSDKIEFIVGDIFKVLPTIKNADVVFMSPPWGGPTYLNAESMDIEDLPIDMIKLFQISQNISTDIAFYMPRNLNPDSVYTSFWPNIAMASLMKLEQIDHDKSSIEFESIYLNERYKALMCYFGKLCSAENLSPQ